MSSQSSDMSTAETADDPPDDPQTGPDVSDELDAVKEFVWKLEDRINDLEAENGELREEISRLERELEAEREARDQLAGRVTELDRRTNILTTSESEMADWDRDDYAAYIVQRLYDRIQNANEGADREVTADMVTVKTAHEDWLNKSMDRSTVYGYMKRAEEMVDGDVVSWVKKPRGADPPSHLKVDLSKGSLELLGQHRVGRCGGSTTPENGDGVSEPVQQEGTRQ